MTGAEIRFYTNPRVEAPGNKLKLDNAQFLDLGLDPVKLSDNELAKIATVVHRFADRADLKKVLCTSTWRHDIKPDYKGKVDEQKQQAAGEAA
jgi:UDP-sulfoquinovose synthase